MTAAPLVLIPKEKEPLVLIPGMMCDARLYGPQIRVFGRTRAVHLPPIGSHDTVEAIAREVLAGAPSRFALAGLSLGGIIAMEVLRQAPDRITRLALMDTNAKKETPKDAANREPQIARVMAGRLSEVMAEEMAPRYLAPGDGQDAILDLILDMALDQGEGVFLRQSRALQKRKDQQAALCKVKVPTLVLCGEHDRLCPIRHHDFMVDLIGPRAELHVIRDAGHLPTLEQPEATTAALEVWLAR